MLKNEKGITLIALVVMLVVTTILAGITINASIGNRGLIKEARDTQSNIEQAKQEGLQQIEDLKNQGKEWRKEYNNFPMRPLGWLSPREFIKKYKSQEESLFAI